MPREDKYGSTWDARHATAHQVATLINGFRGAASGHPALTCPSHGRQKAVDKRYYLNSLSRSSRQRLCALPTSCQCLQTQQAAATSVLSSSRSTVRRDACCKCPHGTLPASSPQKLTLRLVDTETRSFRALFTGEVDMPEHRLLQTRCRHLVQRLLQEVLELIHIVVLQSRKYHQAAS